MILALSLLLVLSVFLIKAQVTTLTCCQQSTFPGYSGVCKSPLSPYWSSPNPTCSSCYISSSSCSGATCTFNPSKSPQICTAPTICTASPNVECSNCDPTSPVCSSSLCNLLLYNVPVDSIIFV